MARLLLSFSFAILLNLGFCLYLDYDDPNIAAESRLGNITDARYLLWTRSNSGNNSYYEVEIMDSDSLSNSPFDDSKFTYFIIHGWGASGLTDWVLMIKDTYLDYDDCNVFSVDYESLVPQPFYIQSLDNVNLVGNKTAHFIDWLLTDTALTVSQIHVGGHSLGAHTAGMTGHYSIILGNTLPRVTGWDPAGPFFNNQTDEFRLNKDDADFVDIIHTNAGTIPEGAIGFYDPVGHVDFYPNGGAHQPGCVKPNVTDWMDMFGACSHHRAMAYWRESVLSSTPFTSWPCVDWDTFAAGGCPTCGQGCLDMGLHVAQNLEGSYYLRTKVEYPYALGDDQTLLDGTTPAY